MYIRGCRGCKVGLGFVGYLKRAVPRVTISKLEKFINSKSHFRITSFQGVEEIYILSSDTNTSTADIVLI